MRLLATIIFLCLAAGCGKDVAPRTNAVVSAEVGVMRYGASEAASELYGGESTTSSPDLFSMGREAIICDTPSRLLVKMPDAIGQVFTTAVRSTTVPNKEITFSVVQRNGEELEVLTSLSVNDNKWHPIQVHPNGGGELLLNASYTMPSAASDAGPEIAWATPNFNASVHPRQSDVIFISIDTLRSASLSQAPFLSKLMATGRQYTNAYSPSNWTLPAFASVVSGLTPQQHGAGRGAFAEVAGGQADKRDFMSLADVPTFAEAFGNAGYATAFIHQNPFLESWTNIQQGFEMYARTADRVDSSQQLATEWWSSNSHRARLLMLHFMEPHWPYSGEDDAQKYFGKNISDFSILDKTPQQRRDFFAVDENVKDAVHAAYNAQIRHLDKQLELTLTELSKTSSDYVVVIHVDHGEELWDQGSFEHGHSFADCVVKVPLAIIHAGNIEASQIGKPVAAHHIGTYLLEHLGIDNSMPASALGDNSNADLSITSTHPLYRCDIGGKTIHADGSYSVINHQQLEYNGKPIEVPADVLATLRQLGYSDD